MAPKQDGNEKHTPLTNESYAIFLVIVMLMLGWVIWYKARNVLVWFIYSIDWVQYFVLYHLNILGPHGKDMFSYVTACFNGQINPFTVQWDEIIKTQEDIGWRLHWFYVVVAFLLPGIVIFKMKGDNFAREFNLTGTRKKEILRFFGIRVENKLLKTLTIIFSYIPILGKQLVTKKKEWVKNGISFSDYQAEVWKSTLFETKFNPDDVSEAESPQKTPLEWLRDNKIVLSKKDGLDDDAVEKAFFKQLGSNWMGIEKAPIYMQALAVMCALNVRFEREKLGKLSDRLNEIYLLNKNGKTEDLIKEAIAPYFKSKPGDVNYIGAINKFGSKHAYQNTAIMGIYGWGGPMKTWGGKGGVLPTASFRWLKTIDRNLFYCLNNVGRRKFHIEGAGAVNHFFAERILQAPITNPRFNEVINSLVEYLDFTGITDLEEFFRETNDFQ
jgi:intracellular multiplication protein IcmP